MTIFFADYYWKAGVPQGISPRASEGYRIISDPYYKWISIERYVNGQFSDIVYDSSLLDFRKLKPEFQQTWQTIPLKEGEERIELLIRNQDDRTIFLESHQFSQGLCKTCEIRSPHGLLLATQRLYRKKFDDPFNGVGLFDRLDKPVVIKWYEIDEQTEMFTHLLKTEDQILGAL